MAVKTSWAAGDVLTAADLTDTFAAKAATSSVGRTLIATANASGSQVSFTNCFSATYNYYEIELSGITLAGAAAIVFFLRASGSNVTTGYTIQRLEAASTTISGDRPAVSSWPVNKSAVDNISGIVAVDNPFAAAATKATGTLFASNGTTCFVHAFSGLNANATSYASFGIEAGGSTYTGGVLTIWGVK